MQMILGVYSKEDAEKAIIAIGQELIRKSADVSRDLENVSSIKIEAVILPGEVVNVNINKNYTARFEEMNNKENSSEVIENEKIL